MRLTLRDPTFSYAVAALAEPIYGRSREELFSEDGRQRKKAIVLRNIAVVGLVLLTALSAIFGVLASKSRTLAEQRSEVNLSARLAANAELALQQFPQRSALLAAEAIQVARDARVNVPSAEDAGRRALEAFHGSTPIRHSGLSAIAVSADGRWLATGGDDKLIRIWDLNNRGFAPRVLEGHTSTPSKVAFSPNGRWMISAGEYWGRGLIVPNAENRALLWHTSSLERGNSVSGPPPKPQSQKGHQKAARR
jgi:hypothetical protein